MILLKDLKTYLKNDIHLVINLGADENNFSNVIFDNKQYDNHTIEDLTFIDDNHLGVKIL